MATKTVGQFVLLSNPEVFPELHATGCRDLHGFNENSLVAESATAALEALTEAGTLAKDAKVRVMPCTNPVRMRAINRLFEVDAETGDPVAPPAPEPVAEVTPEPASTEPTPEPVAEETPTLSKSAAKKARKAAKKAAKAVDETLPQAEVA